MKEIFDPVQNQFVKIGKKVKRNCLRCDQLFLSVSKYNRICKICKEENKKHDIEDWLDTNGHEHPLTGSRKIKK